MLDSVDFELYFGIFEQESVKILSLLIATLKKNL